MSLEMRHLVPLPGLWHLVVEADGRLWDTEIVNCTHLVLPRFILAVSMVTVTTLLAVFLLTQPTILFLI